jgi:DNA replication ATP-dependent helicase Dna2
MPLFNLSPSRIARFFYHECERYMRYHATPRKRWKEDGIPSTSWDTSPVTAAILEGGFTWEREIIQKKLKGRVRIARGDGPINERAFDIEQSLSILPGLKTGEAVYQPTFQAPDSFLERYKVPHDLCEFPPCRPDILQVHDNDGSACLRVIDVKASTSLKVSQRECKRKSSG